MASLADKKQVSVGARVTIAGIADQITIGVARSAIVRINTTISAGRYALCTSLSIDLIIMLHTGACVTDCISVINGRVTTGAICGYC